MKLIWHGHACFELLTENGNIVFDPYSPGSVPGLKLPPLSADAVVCSHMHSDHNYVDGVSLTGACAELSALQLPTFHDGKLGALRGDNICTVIEAEGLRIAHLGDLGHTLAPETAAKFGHIDLLLLPVGGYYTVCAQQAKQIALSLGANTVVPMHYNCGSCGLSNVAPVDDFLSLWDESDILRLDAHECEVRDILGSRVVVLKADPAAII